VRTLKRRLEAIGRSLDRVSMVLLTHEHWDHTQGLRSITRRPGVTVAATPGTLRQLSRVLRPEAQVLELQPGQAVDMGPFHVLPVPIPHDAHQPVGFVIEHGGARLVHITDLGMLDSRLARVIASANALVIESNHDVAMLRQGPYPWVLKRRILDRTGHLSNEALADFLSAENLPHCHTITLAHLSRTNNTPEQALEAARGALAKRRIAPELHVAHHDQPQPLERVLPPGAIPASKRGRGRRPGANPVQLAFSFIRGKDRD
jgi:phosphoribosyl 1,2-cyclic phosphodiesterase